ncbi:YueI family protein [Bacillus suaedaesalsae]|uniref:YueI family protein n=1 Tax=Bacillus suaedaesalsae TaxID=2810349 RepID=A0ABS2DM72_9BACI|nr:YueI family protein [Bacillus suaedaesalsae]MBM6619596.1 YueI family protein [Bacillus suaedaesalsae]
MKKDIEDYITEGIAGPLETKPDERREYLGTIRERVIIALKQGQVREKNLYITDLEKIMKQYPTAKMFLNGNMEYRALSPFVKLASDLNIPYTLSVNGEYNSDFGLVLATDHAIDLEDISLSVNKKENEYEDDDDDSPLKRFFDKLF